jgi:hypothetical protein
MPEVDITVYLKSRVFWVGMSGGSAVGAARRGTLASASVVHFGHRSVHCISAAQSKVIIVSD